MVNVEDFGALVCILGCSVLSLPIEYLGLPLEASYRAKSICDGVVEKMERQLVVGSDI